jgi:aldehyde dehydrogenase (NAD+)
LEAVINHQRAFYLAKKTLSLERRWAILEVLEQTLKNNEILIEQALFADFGKSGFETYTTELGMLYEEISRTKRDLKKWIKPKRVRTNWVNWPAQSYILFEPLGVNLIIGAWNYPVLLLLQPAVSALAAGNTVVLKPSENAPHIAALFQELIDKNFDPAHLALIQADAQKTQKILALAWDHIFFTGSTQVGKIVYQAAAEQLIPVTLELGGKSPAIITPHCDVALTAKRLVWGKFLNAGQTCVAPDYVLIHESVKDAFLNACVVAIEKAQYGPGSNNYCQIINERHMDRLVKLLDQNKVYYGGSIDAKKRFIAPTIMTDVTFDDAVMKEEIFGPILPVMTYQNLNDALAQVKTLDKPLAAYVFSENKKEVASILNDLSFGGGAVNDVVMHLTNPNLPFGGIGKSGLGAYHGYHGYLRFSHQKSILHKNNWFELPLKYAPLTAKKLKWIRKILK